MDQSPDRLSDCSAMTDDSYRTAKFGGSDDDSMSKMSSCQRLYFSTVEEGEGDMTPQAFASEEENVCNGGLASSTDTNRSGSITEENNVLSPQHIAVVKPSFPGLDRREADAGYAIDGMVNNEHFGPSTDFLNTTCALELLDKACSTSASVTRSKLLRQSLLLKFDPLCKNTVCPTDAKQREHSTGRAAPLEAPASILETSFGAPSAKAENSTKSSEAADRKDGSLGNFYSVHERIKKMSEQLEQLSAENAELLERHERLSRIDSENQSALQEMQHVSQEYLAAIGELKATFEKEKARKDDELKEKTRERDQVVDELRSVENSASEVLKKMEKLREASSALKQNERVLKGTAAALKEKIGLLEQRYEKFSAYVDEKLAKLQADKEELSKSRNTESLALKAQCKKYEVLIKSYQEQSKQKTEQINSLISLCNDLSASRC